MVTQSLLRLVRTTKDGGGGPLGMRGRRRGRNLWRQGSQGQPRPPKEWPLPLLTAGNGDLHWHQLRAYSALRLNPRLGPRTTRYTRPTATLARLLQVSWINKMASINYVDSWGRGLKSTSVKRGCIKSEKTPKFGVGFICNIDFIIPI